MNYEESPGKARAPGKGRAKELASSVWTLGRGMAWELPTEGTGPLGTVGRGHKRHLPHAQRHYLGCRLPAGEVPYLVAWLASPCLAVFSWLLPGGLRFLRSTRLRFLRVNTHSGQCSRDLAGDGCQTAAHTVRTNLVMGSILGCHLLDLLEVLTEHTAGGTCRGTPSGVGRETGPGPGCPAKPKPDQCCFWMVGCPGLPAAVTVLDTEQANQLHPLEEQMPVLSPLVRTGAIKQIIPQIKAVFDPNGLL